MATHTYAYLKHVNILELTEKLTWIVSGELQIGLHPATGVTITWPSNLDGCTKYVEISTTDTATAVIDGVSVTGKLFRLPYTTGMEIDNAIIAARPLWLWGIGISPQQREYRTAALALPWTASGLEATSISVSDGVDGADGADGAAGAAGADGADGEDGADGSPSLIPSAGIVRITSYPTDGQHTIAATEEIIMVDFVNVSGSIYHHLPAASTCIGRIIRFVVSGDASDNKVVAALGDHFVGWSTKTYVDGEDTYTYFDGLCSGMWGGSAILCATAATEWSVIACAYD